MMEAGRKKEVAAGAANTAAAKLAAAAAPAPVTPMNSTASLSVPIDRPKTPTPEIAIDKKADDPVESNPSPRKEKKGTVDSAMLSPMKLKMDRSRPSSPSKNVKRSVSPTPDLVPWLTSPKKTTNDALASLKGTVVNGSVDGMSPEKTTAEVNGTADAKEADEKEKSKPLQPEAQPAPSAKNQTQDESFLITKATLADNTTNNESNAKTPENDVKNDVKTGGNEGGRNNDRDPLLKRLRENKVALLTSEAMAQMGCSGFGAKQKEVVSQACNLL